jgi:hypothetical protein
MVGERFWLCYRFATTRYVKHDCYLVVGERLAKEFLALLALPDMDAPGADYPLAWQAVARARDLERHQRERLKCLTCCRIGPMNC